MPEEELGALPELKWNALEHGVVVTFQLTSSSNAYKHRDAEFVRPRWTLVIFGLSI